MQPIASFPDPELAEECLRVIECSADALNHQITLLFGEMRASSWKTALSRDQVIHRPVHHWSDLKHGNALAVSDENAQIKPHGTILRERTCGNWGSSYL